MRADRLQRVVHATTLPTNLVLERKGSRVGYVTTRGFGDIFRISKHKPNGPDRYNMAYRRPEPLVATAETAALGRQLQEQLRAARQGYQAAIASMRTVFTDFTTSEHARISPPA